MTQTEKAERFRTLHKRQRPLVLPNPWDAGTAKILTDLGFEALTTTSYGLAASLGREDGARAVSRDEAFGNAKAIVDATELPVAADLENGYGDEPETVAETIRLAARVGLVGASIEDATGDDAAPIYDFDLAVARVAAAARAARELPFPFMLVARAENHLHGIDDLDDTIARLVAYERAGADVLYAPLVHRAEDLRRLCSSVTKPVNVLTYGDIVKMSLDDLAALGVRRVSVGSGLFHVAMRHFTQAATALHSGKLEWV
jgi:2-methylisocitrate lyase-like PEP mutase family enzyme